MLRESAGPHEAGKKDIGAKPAAEKQVAECGTCVPVGKQAIEFSL